MANAEDSSCCGALRRVQRGGDRLRKVRCGGWLSVLVLQAETFGAGRLRRGGGLETPLIGSSLGVQLGQKHRCKMPKTPNRSQTQLCSRKETAKGPGNEIKIMWVEWSGRLGDFVSKSSTATVAAIWVQGREWGSQGKPGDGIDLGAVCRKSSPCEPVGTPGLSFNLRSARTCGGLVVQVQPSSRNTKLPGNGRHRSSRLYVWRRRARSFRTLLWASLINSSSRQARA